MANVYSLIANGKQKHRPHLVMSIKDRDGKEYFSFEAQSTGDMPIDQKNLEYIKTALRDVVIRATGRRANIASFEAAGKTGTAENPRGPAHAWFLCYAPYDKPQIVIATIVEHGMHGDQVSAGIARDILTWYVNNRVGKKHDL